MSLTINSAAFTRQLRRYAKVNKRSFKDIVNAKALDMAFQALRHTDAASASAVRPSNARRDTIRNSLVAARNSYAR